MKKHAIAFAVLLAACAAPRAERAERPELDSDEPPDEPADNSAGAKCTRETPCPLEVVEVARRRAELEADTEAKIAEANENAHTKKVAASWMQTLSKSIVDERNRFSDWCELAQEWNAAKRKSGARGMTPEDMAKLTGEPTQERRPESNDEGVEARAWTWDVSGPISRSVSFGILFMRPAGSDEPLVFSGCQWCAEGGPATSPGCMLLPAKKP